MKGINVSRLGKTAVRTISKNKSTLLTIAGLLGLGATVYVTVKVAPKAEQKVDEHKLLKYLQRMQAANVEVVSDETLEQMDEDEMAEFQEKVDAGKAVFKHDYIHEKLTVIEYVKATWRHYIWVLLTAGATAAAIIFAHYIDAKMIAGLSVAYAASEKNRAELMEQAKKALEPEDYQKMQEELAQKKAEEQHVEEATLEPGKCWIYDAFNQRYFQATELDVERAFVKAMGDLNHRNGIIDNKFLCDEMGEEAPDYLSDYVWTYERHAGLQHTLRKQAGRSDWYILEYPVPIHYKELGLATPY